MTGVNPYATVVIPTYNRLPILRKCLAALQAQTAPATDYEILVIDDGSSDGTEAYLAEMAEAGTLRYVRQENRGIAVTRNVGVREARGQLIIFVDSDIVVTPGFV